MVMNRKHTLSDNVVILVVRNLFEGVKVAVKVLVRWRLFSGPIGCLVLNVQPDGRYEKFLAHQKSCTGTTAQGGHTPSPWH